MLNSGLDVQTRVLVLSVDHLRALLHVGHCVLGQFLVGSQRCASQGVVGRHHIAHHVHPDSLHQQFPAPSGLHQSHRCLDGGKSDVLIKTQPPPQPQLSRLFSVSSQTLGPIQSSKRRGNSLETKVFWVTRTATTCGGRRREQINLCEE